MCDIVTAAHSTEPAGLRPDLCRNRSRTRLLYYADHVGLTFVHIPKNAGTTVEAALGSNGTGNCDTMHTSARQYAQIDAQLFAAAPSFAVLREPVERTISLYSYTTTYPWTSVPSYTGTTSPAWASSGMVQNPLNWSTFD
eukprot:5222892-Prymnesium_polylepis.2